MTFSRSDSGRWKAKRAYVSFQPTGDLPRTGFRGDTFFVSQKRGDLQHCPFPDDPKLPAAGRMVSRLEQAEASPVKVLRYVPLRRLTLRGPWASATPGPAVVKVIENGGAAHIAAKLEAIEDAARRGRVSFSVATPIAHDEGAATFVQACLPGVPLSEWIQADDLEAVLRRVGATHAEVHALPLAPGSHPPVADPFPTVLERLDWLRFVRPGKAELLRGVQARLEASRPDPARSRDVFCHGDFRCTQVLADGERWSVIDFDDAGPGPACLDVGRFLAFLKYDLPLLATAAWGDAAASAMLARAEAAYLDGYAGRSGAAPDPRGLLWHRGCQEILYLAQLVRRDLADEPAFEAGCGWIERLTAGLGSPAGGPKGGGKKVN
ncbi:MAG TPA: aminoglycoside phosphotransferase family protein [Burkholderiales bacterium]